MTVISVAELNAAAQSAVGVTWRASAPEIAKIGDVWPGASMWQAPPGLSAQVTVVVPRGEGLDSALALAVHDAVADVVSAEFPNGGAWMRLNTYSCANGRHTVVDVCPRLR